MNDAKAPLLHAFEAGTLDPEKFGHREHVEVAFELLRRDDFVTASHGFSTALRAIATRAGAPEKFHVTVTIAFLSLIAERLKDDKTSDFDHFIGENEDLLSKNLLRHWYAPEQLESDFARTHFVLPSTFQ